MAWATERTANPAVLRLHTTEELTRKTIETCPPASAPPPLDRVLEIAEVRSIDLHRYRARLNLVPASAVDPLEAAVRRALEDTWRAPAPLPVEEPPRTFPVPSGGGRRVAESLEMAVGHPVLEALFQVPGVAEAILDQRGVRVRLGRLFRWEEAEEPVRQALAPFPARGRRPREDEAPSPP